MFDPSVIPAAVRSDLPCALAEARAQLAPGRPEAVLSALATIAERRGLALPCGLGLDLDVEIMAEWPEDLFALAFKRVWTTFGYRRMPEVADFERAIHAELHERRARVAALHTLVLRLEAARLREGRNAARAWQGGEGGSGWR